MSLLGVKRTWAGAVQMSARSCNEVPGSGKLDEGTFKIAEPSSSTSNLEKLAADVN
jgi:hypothetical protein